MRLVSARTMRRVLNLWPPFLFTGIHVARLADDYTSARVELRAAAAGGEKVLRWFETPVRDASGDVVATVRKQLYVRRKRARG